MVLPGLIALALFQPDVLVIKKQVAQKSIHMVLALSIIIAIISVFWVRFERHILKNIRFNSVKHIPFSRVQLFFLLAVLGLFAVISLRGIGNIPLFYVLALDFEGAAIAKFNFMNGNLRRAPETLNQMLKYLLPMLTFFIAYNFSQIRKPKITKIFWLILILSSGVVFVAIDGHKVAPFMIIIGVMLLSDIRKKRFARLKNLFVPVTLLLLLFYLFSSSITLGDRNITNVFIERIFFSQTSGAIFIIDRFNPDLELIKHGFIGTSYLFSDLPEHAHSSIMKTVYGVSNTNVNMNSIFIGEAFSWGGMKGAYFSIVFISFYVPLVLFIFNRLSKRNAALYFPITAVFFIFYFPIIQGFNSFLYGRNLIFFLIMASIFSLSRSYSLRGRRVA